MLGFDLDTEKSTISLPDGKIDGLQEMTEGWLAMRRATTIPNVLVFEGKLPRMAYVIRPGMYFARFRLVVNRPQLGGQGKRGGGEGE